mmetsp:Transcript_8204/g.16903  ORF Transcript_8204/g.16903 Transcript_8204/m.16903 type:complete len:251 (-) Transcript_8204:342-1094(-)
MPSGGGSLISRKNSSWLLLISSSSCGLALPSSCNMGCKICGCACTMPRSAWNCWLLRRKLRGPSAAAAPAAPPAGCGANMLRGCVFGPPGAAAAAAAGVPTAGAPACAAGGAAAGGASSSGMPVMRYSTARSGLLKAARIARTTCSRSKPISMIPVIVTSSSAPATSADSPKNAWSDAGVPGCAIGMGVGAAVAGTGARAGAGGTMGVSAGGTAGVGATAGVAPTGGAAGAGVAATGAGVAGVAGGAFGF